MGQKRSRDVVCWQCGEKGHLQCDCPHKEADEQVEGIVDPNAYAGRSEQIIRINQPITVATRDNIYKQMGSQRTKANICHAPNVECARQQRHAHLGDTLTTMHTGTN